MNQKNVRCHLVWCMLAAFLLLCAPNVSAQIAQGSIAGTVTDPSGGVLPGVNVTSANEGTGIERTTTTDQGGIYVFPTVIPGFYTIRAELDGFNSYSATGLQVQVAQRVNHDIELEVGQVTTQVEVVAQTPVLEQRNAEIAQVVSQQEVEDLPLNGRDFLDLAKLVPGVTQLPTSTQSTGVSINGQRANQIGFYFDGIDTRLEGGNSAYKPSIDAIQEFRIQTNAFSAEYGRTPGVINLSLKPGTNEFHGALFEFLRNDQLDARSFFDPGVDVLRRNQFGGVVSGPVVRNRTFFMFNYEGLRTRRSATEFATVPTNLQRNGDFSANNPIFDPLTLGSSTTQRQPFPNNVIPQDRFGQMGRSALQYYPAPNRDLIQGSNFVSPASLVDDGDQFHTRIDHNISDSDLLFGRYSYNDGDNLSPSGLPLTGNISTTKAHSFTVQESHTFGPTAINELRVGWTFFESTSVFPTADRNIAAEDFGLINLNTPVFGLPRLEVSGLSDIGASPFRIGVPYTENIYTLADDMNIHRGRHSFKFGVEGRYYRPALPVQATPNGIIRFFSQFTNQPGVSNTGNAVADLLLGFPAEGRGTQLVESNGYVSLKYFNWGFYFQDEIKLRPNLTVNLGLRYEYQTPYKERFDDVFFFDVPGGGRFLQPGVDIEHLQNPDYNNFAPRVGIAYSINQKTVIRTGAGVFYGLPRTGEFGAFHLSPPFTVDSTLFSDPLVPDLVGRLWPPARVRDANGDVLLTPNTGVFTLDTKFRTAYTYQWNFSIQRELAQNVLLELAYVGNSAHKLTGRDLENQAFLDADPINNPTPVNSRRPVPQIGDVSTTKSLDNSNYHAFNLKLNKRYSNGVSLIGAYTFSKALGIGGALFGDQSRGQNVRDRASEYGPLDLYSKHRFTAGWIYELPFGQGKPLGGGVTGVASKFISGWSVQGIFTATSGFPIVFGLRSSVSSFVGRQDMNRPDRICDGNLDKSERTLQRFFDTSCFVNHAFGVFGNSGNGVLIGPGINNFDITVMKNTRIGERFTVQFRSEYFNAFNHPSFADPGATVGTSTYGVINGTRIRGREIQLGMKLIF